MDEYKLELRPEDSAELALPSGTPEQRAPGAVRAYIGRLLPATRAAYDKDLRIFARWLGKENIHAVLPTLVKPEHQKIIRGQMNEICLRWQNAMTDEGISPATINRRISAVKALLAALRMAQLIEWDLDIKAIKHQKYRDTQGPGTAGCSLMLDGIDQVFRHDQRQKARNLVIFRMFWDLGLRRKEVAALNVNDLDLQNNTVTILRKGQRETETKSLTPPLLEAIIAWLKIHPTPQKTGPLLVALDRANLGHRLTGKSLHRIIQKLGEEVGIKEGQARPHGIRHASVTEAYRLTKDINKTAKFSGHQKKETVFRYIDNMEDEGGELSAQVSASLTKATNTTEERPLTGGDAAGKLVDDQDDPLTPMAEGLF